MHVWAKWVSQVLGEDCINLFSCECHIQEREAVPHGKNQHGLNSFYSVPENSSGYAGSLRLIGEGLWWSHQRERNDSVTPAEQSQVLPAFGLHSRRQDAWPGFLVLVRAWGSEDKQRSLFFKESEFLTCRGFQNSCSGQSRAQARVFSCLAFSSEINLNPKSLSMNVLSLVLPCAKSVCTDLEA